MGVKVVGDVMTRGDHAGDKGPSIVADRPGVGDVSAKNRVRMIIIRISFNGITFISMEFVQS